MPRFPLDNARVASGFATKDRPEHYGLDVVGGKADVDVKAPEDGVVVDVYRGGQYPKRADGSLDPKGAPDPEGPDNTRALGQTDLTRTVFPGIANPWDGYGPGGVLIQGDSGAFHLLAHLPAQTVAVGDHVTEGDVVGHLATHVGASGPHVHWEVRSKALSTLGGRKDGTLDPAAWLGQKPPHPKGALVPAPVDGAGAIPWWVWLGLGVLVLRSRRRR